jgi:hypothetical protein
MQELVVNDLDEEEKARAQAHLSRSNPSHPLTRPLQRVLRDAETLPSTRPGRVARFQEGLRNAYQRAADLPVFANLLVVFFAGQLVLKFGYLFALMFLRDVDPQEIIDRRVVAHFTASVQNLTFVDKAEIVVGFVTAFFVLMGILAVRGSRLRAYRYFRTSILINIFLTEIFVFAKEEFSALIGFFFNLTVLLALNYVIKREGVRLGSPDADG